MQEAVVATVFLAVSVIIGSLLKPNEDQLRPLTPQASSGGDGHHDDHHGGHH
jgi:hypothetical protein